MDIGSDSVGSAPTRRSCYLKSCETGFVPLVDFSQ